MSPEMMLLAESISSFDLPNLFCSSLYDGESACQSLYCIVQPVKAWTECNADTAPKKFFTEKDLTFDAGGAGVWWHTVDDFPTVEATRPTVKYALKSGNSAYNFLRKLNNTDVEVVDISVSYGIY
jgi:hypothetical protein